MVRELRLENRWLRDQLHERKLEVEDLRDDHCSFRHGLSAKLKHLYKVRTGRSLLGMSLSLVSWALG